MVVQTATFVQSITDPIEYWEVDNLPDVERQEIREIYAAKGFEGELLEQIVTS